MGRQYRQELRLEGTDLDNPSSGQTPTSCPRGLILGGLGGGPGDLKRMDGPGPAWGAEDGSGEHAHPLLEIWCWASRLRDSAGAVKPRSRGIRLP